MRLVKDVDATLEKTAASLDEYRDSFKQLLKKWYILLIGVLLTGTVYLSAAPILKLLISW